MRNWTHGALDHGTLDHGTLNLQTHCYVSTGDGGSLFGSRSSLPKQSEPSWKDHCTTPESSVQGTHKGQDFASGPATRF